MVEEPVVGKIADSQKPFSGSLEFLGPWPRGSALVL